jgi:hypothetical protein
MGSSKVLVKSLEPFPAKKALDLVAGKIIIDFRFGIEFTVPRESLRVT